MYLARQFLDWVKYVILSLLGIVVLLAGVFLVAQIVMWLWFQVHYNPWVALTVFVAIFSIGSGTVSWWDDLKWRRRG
jgi:membrane-bound ClpP family serine protease